MRDLRYETPRIIILQAMRERGLTVRAFARLLRRHEGTISRQLRPCHRLTAPSYRRMLGTLGIRIVATDLIAVEMR